VSGHFDWKNPCFSESFRKSLSARFHSAKVKAVHRAAKILGNFAPRLGDPASSLSAQLANPAKNRFRRTTNRSGAAQTTSSQ